MTDRLPDAPSGEVHAIQLTRVSDLIDRALKGELPREREPRHWEPKVLTPAHINMVLDRAGGYTLVEIAERWEYTEAQVANVLGSPDAQTILSTILSMQANALVSMEERFKALAPQALNVKVEILQDKNVHPGVRDKVASDILDRAGYAPRKQEEIKHTHQILLPAQAATGLRDILEESRRVASVDYSTYLKRPDAEVAALSLQVDEAGHLLPAGGASPATAPDLSSEKVA